MKRDHWLYLAAALGGAAVWIAITAATGRREAWDSEWYFTLGIPAVCLLSLVLGYIEPHRPWRWGILPLAGQFAWMLVTNGPGNLLPLGVIMFGILSIPSIITAWVGSVIGRRIRLEGAGGRG
jgi:hypothetical protein